MSCTSSLRMFKLSQESCHCHLQSQATANSIAVETTRPQDEDLTNNILTRLRQTDVKAGHYERKVQALESAAEGYEKKYEELQSKHEAVKKELEDFQAEIQNI